MNVGRLWELNVKSMMYECRKGVGVKCQKHDYECMKAMGVKCQKHDY